MSERFELVELQIPTVSVSFARSFYQQLFGLHLGTGTDINGFSISSSCGGELYPCGEDGKQLRKLSSEEVWISCNSCDFRFLLSKFNHRHAELEQRRLLFGSALFFLQFRSELWSQSDSLVEDLRTFMPPGIVPDQSEYKTWQSFLYKDGTPEWWDMWLQFFDSGFPIWPEYGMVVVGICDLETVRKLILLLMHTAFLLQNLEKNFQEAAQKAAGQISSASRWLHPKTMR